MRVLSLFNGMCGANMALGEGHTYYTSEIDKHAVALERKLFPENIQLGDVTKWQDWNLPWDEINIIVAGSPCQGFSFAGKQLNFDDPRSKLFWVFTDILNWVRLFNPDVKFMLENVKMKKEYERVITDALGVKPVEINSALVSAQNRRRLYWCNWGVTQPEDRGIVLKDILEFGVVDRDKSYCVDANYWKGTTVEHYINKKRRQIAFTEVRTEEGKRIRREFKAKYGRDFRRRRSKELAARKDGKMNCLTDNY